MAEHVVARLVLGLSMFMLWSLPTQAAPRRIEPLPEADCRALAKELASTIGIRLATSIGQADKESFIADLSGDACLISGKGKDNRRSFGDVSLALRKRFADWQEQIDLQADGPDGTIAGYRKNERFVIYSLQVEPPPECNNVIIGDCKAIPARWMWTVKVAAFRVQSRP